MKNFVVNPIGLKGKEIHERQLALMGINLITENKNDKKSAVELTKIGPDGNAYAIVRENHEYYIKKSNKTNGLVLEDFKYIGGLQNKKEAAYPSYAKAIKQLNLKFKSLAEAYNKGGDINVFEDDNLLSESAFGMGFSNQGNMEGMDEMWAEETVSEYDKKAMQNFIDQYGEEKGKQIYYATANKEDRNPETFEKTDEEIEMNEYEMAIDEMINSLNNEGTDPEDDFYPDAPFRNEELHGGQHNLDVDKDGDIEADDLKALRARKHMDEEEMSDKDKEFAALAEPKDKITYADKIAGAKLKEIDAIFEGIKSFDDIIGEYDGLKKKL